MNYNQECTSPQEIALYQSEQLLETRGHTGYSTLVEREDLISSDLRE